VCSRSQSGVSRRDRVILLGKRQRADGRGKLAEERTEGKKWRGLGEEGKGTRKFARNYIYGVRSGTLTRGREVTPLEAAGAPEVFGGRPQQQFFFSDV